MRVSLNTEFADMLIVGGLPALRLPMLVALFVIAAGLLTVALVQLRRQQELARLRTEFVSGVSHELRTPLAQIRWFAELLHLGKLRSEDERARSAAIIDQEARRLTYLVENVLNFSRSEKGTNRISPAPVDLDHEILEALELFAPLARARKMLVATALDASAVISARPRCVPSDSAQPPRQRREVRPGGPNDHRRLGDRRRPRARLGRGPGSRHSERGSTPRLGAVRPTQSRRRIGHRRQRHWTRPSCASSCRCTAAAPAPKAPRAAARAWSIELPLTQPDSGESSRESSDSPVQLKAVT